MPLEHSCVPKSALPFHAKVLWQNSTPKSYGKVPRQSPMAKFHAKVLWQSSTPKSYGKVPRQSPMAKFHAKVLWQSSTPKSYGKVPRQIPSAMRLQTLIHIKLQSSTQQNDLNECSEYGSCHQLCTNEKGSYKCSCANGYLLAGDRKACKSGGSFTPRLIFANRYDIKSYTLNGSDYRLVAGGMKGIVGLDFDVANNYVYWTDVTHEILQRARIDKYSSNELLLRNLHTPDGLTVDWIGRKLYWTDTGLKKIEVAEMDGTKNTDLVEFNATGQPRAIACDPNEGYLYWTDWGSQAGIERIGMDGDNSTRQHLISDNIVWPNGLTLDFAQNKMYWVDSKLKRLEVANMDGSGRKLLAHNTLNKPFALTNFEDNLYWTDWETKGIRTMNKFKEPYEVKTFSMNHMSPMGIKVLHPLKQPAGINPCGSNNGGCSHLCLISRNEERFSCQCPRGMYIQADGKKCGGTPVTRKPRPSQYPISTGKTTPVPSRKTVTSGFTQGTVKPVATTENDQGHFIIDTLGPVNKYIVYNIVIPISDGTGASVGLVIGITLSLLVICLGIGTGVWYYRTRQQGQHSIMYYKDMSTAPLEEDFDGSNDEEKTKIPMEYEGV
eukprot:gene5428-601_t